MEETGSTTTTTTTTATTTNTVSASVSPLSTPQTQPQPQQQQQQPVIMNMNMNMNMNMGINGGVTTTTASATTTNTVSSSGAATVATITATPGSGGGGGQGSLDLFGKKKRGRPRKYDSDGNLRVTYQNAAKKTPTLPLPLPSPPGFTLSPSSPAYSSEFSSSKRGRGRSTSTAGPAGNNWNFLASFGEVFANSAGRDFTPHVVTVHTGEDVAGKILSFAQKGPRGICVLSANGAISNVTIRQPGSSGGLLTYEGRFEILSLSGSYTVLDNGGMRSRTGGLSVSLAGPDGRVVGGGVAGLLTAAAPIQLVVGSFMPNGYKTPKRKYHREHTVASPISGGLDTVTAARPISQANPDGGNFLIPTSQLPEQSQRESASVSSEKLNLDASPHAAAATWNGSEKFSDQRISPDINISLPDE